MVAVLLVNNQNKSQTEVDAATRQLVADLRSIQNDALTGKYYVDDITSIDYIACKTSISLKNGIGDYDIKYWEGDCSSSPLEIADLGRNVSLRKAKITIPAPGLDGDISFSTPSGTVDLSTIGKKIQLVSERDGTTTNTICIDSSSGNITENKGTDCL